MRRDGPNDGDGKDVLLEAISRLERQAGLDQGQVLVMLRERRVVLSGRVRDRGTRKLAEVVVGRAPGVEGVQNELEVEDQPRAEPVLRPAGASSIGGSIPE